MTFQNEATSPWTYYVRGAAGRRGTIAVALPLEPVGREYGRIAQVFKDYVLTEATAQAASPRWNRSRST